MLIGKDDSRIFDFLEYMRSVDKNRSNDKYWYSDPTIDRYVVWSIIALDGRTVACSAVQQYTHANVARILTRFAIDTKYRTAGLQQPTIGGKTFAFQMVEEQLEFCKKAGFDHAFFSTENNRRGVVERHSRIAKKLGLNCEVLPDKYNTCVLINNNEINTTDICWQNIGLYPLSRKEFPLAKLLSTS